MQGNQPARGCQQKHQGVIGHFFAAVIGHIADDDSQPACCFEIDIIDARLPLRTMTLQLGQGIERSFPQLHDVVNHQSRRLPGPLHHLHFILGEEQTEVGNPLQERRSTVESVK